MGEEKVENSIKNGVKSLKIVSFCYKLKKYSEGGGREIIEMVYIPGVYNMHNAFIPLDANNN